VNISQSNKVGPINNEVVEDTPSILRVLSAPGHQKKVNRSDAKHKTLGENDLGVDSLIKSNFEKEDNNNNNNNDYNDYNDNDYEEKNENENDNKNNRTNANTNDNDNNNNNNNDNDHGSVHSHHRSDTVHRLDSLDLTSYLSQNKKENDNNANRDNNSGVYVKNYIWYVGVGLVTVLILGYLFYPKLVRPSGEPGSTANLGRNNPNVIRVPRKRKT